MRTFRDFMESALYHPETGFYSTRIHSNDFYTAPELHPVFGAVLADRLAQLLRRVQMARPDRTLSLVEGGCGEGLLAAQVARRLRERHPDICRALRFILIDRSRRDLTAAIRRLTAFGLPVDAHTDLARLPAFFGALYSNELFDALPAHLLQKSGERIYEVHVDTEGREVLGELSTPDLAIHAATILPALSEGQRHAVSLEAPRWLMEAATKLDAGFLLTLDYGKRFACGTPNRPRAYRAHQIENDLTASPGSRDLTVPADFSALIAAGEAAGASLESYQSLSQFLVEGDIGGFLDFSAGDFLSYKERAQIKTLLHPEGMGEAFKVMIQRKNA